LTLSAPRKGLPVKSSKLTVFKSATKKKLAKRNEERTKTGEYELYISLADIKAPGKYVGSVFKNIYFLNLGIWLVSLLK